MSSRSRDRGTTVISAEERARRITEAKSKIRESATFTPALLGRIESRIDSNAFRRCISDNTIYQSLCNSLKDKNVPERERRPDLVDFLALEAIVAVNYDGEYNKVLKDLFIRCNTAAWVEKAVLLANQEWYRDNLSDAHKFIKTLINKVDSQLLEIILEDIDTSFWRQALNDHVLYKKILEKLKNNRDLSQRDVLTAVALNGGRYPTEVFRHLIVHQNSAMCHWGNNVQAQHALYEDDEFQDTRAQNTVVSDTMANLESFADAMHDKDKSKEIRKKVRELKDIMKGDLGLLRHTLGGRIQKNTGGGGRVAIGGIGNDLTRLNSLTDGGGTPGVLAGGGTGSAGGAGGSGGVAGVQGTGGTGGVGGGGGHLGTVGDFQTQLRPTHQRHDSITSSAGDLFVGQDGATPGGYETPQSQMQGNGSLGVDGGGMGGLGSARLHIKREAFSPGSDSRVPDPFGPSY
ncbi:hypothetical protein CSIM01_05280 [Colletotrichum simmondsii]|uniref:Uncharacterized protein n=1 Tax=Colletotrichum simmondsii TaxID=703756 RepID=A0A135TGQ6_9PEZI|nr:hypothetical protein CSIM01_05280 [Colletotrichum simmondsii]